MRLFSFLFLGVGTVIAGSCFVITLFLCIACICSITEISLWTFIALASMSYLIGLAGNNVLVLIETFFRSIAKRSDKEF